jgi:putative flippase GtrA
MNEKKSFLFSSKYIKFTIGGIIVFLFQWVLTILLTELFYFENNISYTLALGLGLLLLFSFHEKITFKINTPHRIKILQRFFLMYIFVFILNWSLVYFLSKEITYVLAIPLVNMCLSIFLYPLNKRWIFGIFE